jgi:hypothetical protein
MPSANVNVPTVDVDLLIEHIDGNMTMSAFLKAVYAVSALRTAKVTHEEIRALYNAVIDKPSSAQLWGIIMTERLKGTARIMDDLLQTFSAELNSTQLMEEDTPLEEESFPEEEVPPPPAPARSTRSSLRQAAATPVPAAPSRAAPAPTRTPAPSRAAPAPSVASRSTLGLGALRAGLDEVEQRPAPARSAGTSIGTAAALRGAGALDAETYLSTAITEDGLSVKVIQQRGKAALRAYMATTEYNDARVGAGVGSSFMTKRTTTVNTLAKNVLDRNKIYNLSPSVLVGLLQMLCGCDSVPTGFDTAASNAATALDNLGTQLAFELVQSLAFEIAGSSNSHVKFLASMPGCRALMALPLPQ